MPIHIYSAIRCCSKHPLAPWKVHLSCQGPSTSPRDVLDGIECHYFSHRCHATGDPMVSNDIELVWDDQL